MQKGQFTPAAPILLVAFLSLALAATSVLARPYDVGPLLPIDGLKGITGRDSDRPIITSKLPPSFYRSKDKQSGPDADSNLTPTASVSQELQPAASPGTMQNRVLFSTNGVDADLDGQLDNTTPAADADYDLWVMRSDGSEQIKVMDMADDQVDPAYDPSGGLIVFSTRVNGIWQLATIQILNPSVVTYITSGPGNKRHPTWSPDCNWLAFQSDVNGTYDIYKIKADGTGSPIAVTSGAANDTSPSWSMTSSLIAFARENGGVSRICTVNSSDGSITQLSNGGGSATVSDKDPAWRQNSTELAFSSNRLTAAGDTSSDYNVFRMAPVGEAGGAVVTLVSNSVLTDSYDDTDPSWTMDITSAPTRIVFVSTRAGGQPDIWAMQMSDTEVPVLTTLPTAIPRQAIPGDDVTISVPVYDIGTGVRQVLARIKDPDIKLYDDSWFGGAGQPFDTSMPLGILYVEEDCRYVGQVELLDDDGDGVFSGAWPTPAAAAGSDYIIDISVTDWAGNTLTYDDVYGFSTQTFAPVNNILFVDDYCEGQRFLSLKGRNNDFPAAWPVESYYTYNPSTYGDAWVASTIDMDSIAGPYDESYDTWRVICRGPIPNSVYAEYLPTVEYQLDPAKMDSEGSVNLTADRPVKVANRCVIWASPHVGNVWTADGTITDTLAQERLRNFIGAGGRLLMSGEDIAWTLTGNGAYSNSFLTSVLHAAFVSDVPYPHDAIARWGGRVYRMENSTVEYSLRGQINEQIAGDAWQPSGYHIGDARYWYHTDDEPYALHTPMWTPSAAVWWNDAAPFSIRPDVITAVGSDKIYGIGNAEATTPPGSVDFATAPTVGVKWIDSTGNGGRVVYLSFGFETLNRGYHPAASPIPAHCKNVRSHLMHNYCCWSRTGGLQGQALSVSDGGQAVNDPAPIVTATRQDDNTYKYAVRCQKDGNWIMQGLPPGHYTVVCTRPGYEIDHYEDEWVHGGQIGRDVDLTFKRSDPGAISGTVTSASSGAPLANVVVSVAYPEGSTETAPLPDSVVTAANGTYIISGIPAGDYVVTADGTSLLYESQDKDATVTIGDSTTVDFALEAADGTLVATVTDVDTGDPIVNAAVVITDSSNTKQTVYTDDAGKASVDLPPGNYSAVISASGYQASASQTFAIEPAETYALAAALKEEPGGTIRGRVVAATSGSFIGGAAVRVFFGSEEVASGTTQTTAVNPGGSVLYNYEITDVPTGDVTVTVERSGFTSTPARRSITVTSGASTDGVNFSMQSLRTFPKGLQLISMPYDYSAIDPATLLGHSSLSMATWEAARQRYRVYPDAPADRFRLGTGYWMNLTSSADLSQEGVAGTDPVEIPLAAGWNLIGCPCTSRVDFYLTTVRDSDGNEYTLQQALSKGLIATGLYAYVLGGYQTVGVLSPYTGYWLKAYQPCSLVISEKVASLAAGASRDATPKVADGWLLQLKTAVGQVQDSATYLGAAAAATSGCDFGLDQAKPPTPALGRYVYTAIDNAGWSKSGGDYAVDIRSSGQRQVFDLKVSTNMAGRKVRLSWGDMSGLPATVRPLLVDQETGQRVYMRTNTAYSFTAGKDARRLQVVVEATGAGALAITPAGAVSTAAGTAISYTLSQAATVDVTVCNIAGRVVRAVVSGQSQTAGRNTVVWDGRDSKGLQSPSGRYLISIVGRTDSGQQVRSVVPLQKVVR